MERKKTYRGREIKIQESEEKLSLTIDGHDIDLAIDPDSKRYASNRLPYEQYGSPEEVAERLIDIEEV